MRSRSIKSVLFFVTFDGFKCKIGCLQPTVHKATHMTRLSIVLRGASIASKTSLITAAALACAWVAGGAQAASAHAGYERMPIPDAAQMKRLCASTIAKAGKQVGVLERGPVGSKAMLTKWNQLDEILQAVDGISSLVANVFTDKAVREAAEACSTDLTAFSAKLFQNERVFKNMSAVVPKDAVDAQLKKSVVEGFEDTGVTLSLDKRARIKAILDKLEQLSQNFDRNVREDPTTVTMSAGEVAGMPETWLKLHKKDASGNFIVNMSYPAYLPYMQQGMSEEARERLWMAKSNEGGDKNLEILNEISDLRREMASLFGSKSYADHVARRRMAGSAGAVDRFLIDVKAATEAGERQDIADLTAAKAKHTGQANAVLKRWDSAFYSERLRKERFSIDQEALRKNFPTQASLDFMFKVASDLYGVKFVPAADPKAVKLWHPDVRYVEVRDVKTNAFIGGVYMDLFPRDDKYNHAAAWPVRGVSTLTGRKPFSVLVTNFSREGLTHDELETLLHEFGHVLHGALSTSRYLGLAGTAVKRDFVEAPSQMFEEWARNPETLALFKTVCPACPALSNEQIAKLEAARTYGRGSRYARQHLYAAYDMALHGEKRQDAQALWAQMESATPLGHVKATKFVASFGHLASGYGAGYYGYLWSEVIALDMLSAFKGKLMDPSVGKRYRDIILASGGQREPIDMVKELLGREPNRDAFYAEISGKR